MNYTLTTDKIKKNKKIWIFVIAGIFLIILITLTAQYMYGSLNYKESLLNRHKDPSQIPNPAGEENGYESDIGAATNVINILFLGIDKSEERESWLGVYRSDNIVIVRALFPRRGYRSHQEAAKICQNSL